MFSIGANRSAFRGGMGFALPICTMATSVDKPSPRLRRIGLLALACGSLAAAGTRADGGAPLAPAAIAAAAEARVRATLGTAVETSDAARAVLHVRAQPPDPRLRLAHCTAALRTRIETEQTQHGRALVKVACPQPAWSVFVPVRIETETEVLVATRPLARGSTPTTADLRLERRRFSGVSENYVKSADELSRYRLRRPLAPGALLARDAIERAPVVQRGSLVTVRAQSGSFRIDAAGRALADAAPGQRVRVQNTASLKVVEGVADNLGIVRLDP
jgi:flagella basal body P-ring formation protein FlgA